MNVFNKFSCVIPLILMAFNAFGQNYQEGLDEYFTGDLNKAIDLFTEAINSEDQVPKAYMMRGAAKVLLDDFYGATSDLNASCDLDSTDYKAYYYLGKTHLASGFSNMAVKYLDKCVDLMIKDDSKVYNLRAAARIATGDYMGAIEDENIAIKTDGANASYYTNRGYAKFMLKQYDSALEDLNFSIELSPTHKAFANRGQTYYILKKYPEAILNFSQALEIEPNDFEVYYQRGLCYESISNSKLACSDFEMSSSLGYSIATSKRNKHCEK